MKLRFLSILLTVFFVTGFAQENSEPFQYIEMKEEFDLLVDFTMVNAECATESQIFYSVIIGTAVVGDFIERISVLIPCLGNEYMQGELITVKPIEKPDKNIVYMIQNFTKDGQQQSHLFGSEFPAVWGEVVRSY